MAGETVNPGNSGAMGARVESLKDRQHVVEADVVEIARVLTELRIEFAVFRSELCTLGSVLKWGMGILATVMGGLVVVVIRLILGL